MKHKKSIRNGVSASAATSSVGAAMHATPAQPAGAGPSATAPGLLELTDQTFAPYINGHPFAVVGFRGPSSAQSRAFEPTFAAAAARHPDLLFVQVDAEAQRGIAQQFQVGTLPTVLVFRSNIVVQARRGGLDARALEAAIQAARGLDMAEVRRKVAQPEPGAPVATRATGTPVPAADDPGLLSIETLLRPALRGPGSVLAQAAERLAAGGLVAIPNAFEADFAERMHRCLDRQAAWRVHENYAERFCYHHHNIYHPEEFPADVAWCARAFDSPASKAWASRLSGRSCIGPTSISASWYLPGDHSLPHTDNVTTGAHFIRQLAFVWHLAQDWQPEWGGALYWCPEATYLPSAFNTLYLFNVSPASTHFVTRVSPFAQGKRLTINGWWTGPAATGEPTWTGPERLAAGDLDILVY